MSKAELYAELGIDFSPTERLLFLKELASAEESFQGTLGGAADAPVNEANPRFRLLMERLGKESLKFSPVLDVLELEKKYYDQRGITIPLKIADRMRSHRFFLLNFPITLIAAPGSGFYQLECIIAFDADGQGEQRPVVYEVFPKEAWQDVIRAGQSLKVGLDENLEFKTPPLPLPGVGGTNVGASAQGTAGLILGPFTYNIRRPRITSRGQGNVEAYWRLEGEDILEQEDPHLGVVLAVPNKVKQVSIQGVAKAAQRFHPLTANVSHLLDAVRKKTRRFFEEDAPLVDECEWGFSNQEA